MTPVGLPSYHVEVLPNWIFTYIAHVTSMAFEGVFERDPYLMFVAVEGGCEWLGPMMWRLDRQWEELRAEVPQATRRPSEILREHLRVATQPLCEPTGRNDLHRFMEWGGAEQIIVFSSDYPHYDYDDAPWVHNLLPAEWRDRVMAKNAVEMYNLPDPRPVDYLDAMAPRNRRMDAGERNREALETVGAGRTHPHDYLESVD
jgi:predicted TIM-barrel fold metal-dependent hydrolase